MLQLDSFEFHCSSQKGKFVLDISVRVVTSVTAVVVVGILKTQQGLYSLCYGVGGVLIFSLRSTVTTLSSTTLVGLHMIQVI